MGICSYGYQNKIDQKKMLERYCACMTLAAVGDAIGYKNGYWEFNFSGKAIHKEFEQITQGQGMKNLNIEGTDWIYSDDTVLHMATAKALASEDYSEE